MGSRLVWLRTGAPRLSGGALERSGVERGRPRVGEEHHWRGMWKSGPRRFPKKLLENKP